MEGPVFHNTPSKTAVPIIEPISVIIPSCFCHLCVLSFKHLFPQSLYTLQCKSIGGAPLCGIIFRDDGIVISDTTGKVQVWERPGLLTQQ